MRRKTWPWPPWEQIGGMDGRHFVNQLQRDWIQLRTFLADFCWFLISIQALGKSICTVAKSLWTSTLTLWPTIQTQVGAQLLHHRLLLASILHGRIECASSQFHPGFTELDWDAGSFFQLLFSELMLKQGSSQKKVSCDCCDQGTSAWKPCLARMLRQRLHLESDTGAKMWVLSTCAKTIYTEQTFCWLCLLPGRLASFAQNTKQNKT